jgi:hypothetical protein
MSLSHTSQQITIYGGLFLVIGGLIGNGMNILVFSSIFSLIQYLSLVLLVQVLELI